MAVEVEGREDDLAALSVEDFVATVDVQDIAAGRPTEVPVKVTSRRDGVRVLAVDPRDYRVNSIP